LVDINDYPIDQLNIAILKKLVIEFKAERIIGQTNFYYLGFQQEITCQYKSSATQTI
jgi:hypothetical protein